jgi:hypothetical protein
MKIVVLQTVILEVLWVFTEVSAKHITSILRAKVIFWVMALKASLLDNQNRRLIFLLLVKHSEKFLYNYRLETKLKLCVSRTIHLYIRLSSLCHA